MGIGCPACAATYEVPDERLAPGRVVRCARCGSDWVPREAESEPPPAPEPRRRPVADETFIERIQAGSAVPEVIPIPGPARTATPEPRRAGGAALVAAWAASLVLVASALWFAYAERAAVMSAWPPSARAYQWIGLTRP